jgi:hypothetical protein
MLLQSLEENCKGNYVNIDPDNTKCLSDYEDFSQVSMILHALIVIYLVYYHCHSDQVMHNNMNNNDIWTLLIS